VFDAVVWALDWRSDPKAALQKAESFGTHLSANVGWVAPPRGVGGRGTPYTEFRTILTG